jgi:alpha-D-ribose 1-methylphosphonate 5-triphosphate synthase subunit PhnG
MSLTRTSHPTLTPEQARRRDWMAVLAKSRPEDLETAWGKTRLQPHFTWLRQPEFGAVMVRGRTGGTGQKFNLGETVATRCALRLACGTAGYAYILGRSIRHAELAALCDALLQTADHHDTVQRAVVTPLAQAYAERRDERSRRANATKVEFLAMARGVSLTSKVAYRD